MVLVKKNRNTEINFTFEPLLRGYIVITLFYQAMEWKKKQNNNNKFCSIPVEFRTQEFLIVPRKESCNCNMYIFFNFPRKSQELCNMKNV